MPSANPFNPSRRSRDEAVVESSRYKCKYGGLGCYGAYRHVLKICTSCEQKVSIMSTRELPDLERSLD